MDRRKAIRREYFIRLATVTIWMLIILIVVQGILLLPSYIYESQTVKTRTTALQGLSASLATTQQQQVQSNLKALQAKSTYLLTLGKIPTVSSVLRAILAVPRPGISLSSFTYTPSTGASPSSQTRTMQLGGVALTREDLSAYNTALSALPFVSNANLPISDYAQASNIPFTITLTGSLLP